MQVAYTYDLFRHDLTCLIRRRTEWSRKGVKLSFFVARNTPKISSPPLLSSVFNFILLCCDCPIFLQDSLYRRMIDVNSLERSHSIRLCPLHRVRGELLLSPLREVERFAPKGVIQTLSEGYKS